MNRRGCSHDNIVLKTICYALAKATIARIQFRISSEAMFDQGGVTPVASVLPSATAVKLGQD